MSSFFTRVLSLHRKETCSPISQTRTRQPTETTRVQCNHHQKDTVKHDKRKIVTDHMVSQKTKNQWKKRGEKKKKKTAQPHWQANRAHTLLPLRLTPAQWRPPTNAINTTPKSLPPEEEKTTAYPPTTRYSVSEKRFTTPQNHGWWRMARTQFDVSTGRFNSSFTGAVSAEVNQRRQHKHPRSVTTYASVRLALTNTRQLAQARIFFVFFFFSCPARMRTHRLAGWCWWHSHISATNAEAVTASTASE